MFPSITGATGPEQERVEQVPKSSPPWVWVGFLFAGAFLIMEFALVIMGLDESELVLAFALL
jgi:hypothetical protein